MSLAIERTIAIGPGAELLPAERRLPVPKPGTSRRGGRLPLLAAQAARALSPAPHGESTAVLFGTGLGALTETEVFLRNLIEHREATPKPRAFSASVHNAIASRVALELGAKGECQTFVHGEVAFVQALAAAIAVAARDPSAAILVGGLDETPPGSFAAIAGAAPTEGGAVLLCGGRDSPITPRVDVTLAVSRRAREPAVTELAAGAPVLTPAGDALGGIELAALPGAGSAIATLTALAAECLAGAVEPGELGLDDRPSRLVVATRSAFGDVGVVGLEAR